MMDLIFFFIFYFFQNQKKSFLFILFFSFSNKFIFHHLWLCRAFSFCCSLFCVRWWIGQNIWWFRVVWALGGIFWENFVSSSKDKAGSLVGWENWDRDMKISSSISLHRNFGWFWENVKKFGCQILRLRRWIAPPWKEKRRGNK